MNLKECLIAAALVFGATFGYQAYQNGGLTPVAAGARHIVILHETDDDTPAMALLLTGLRVGEFGKYIQDHGHRLDILDDDQDPRSPDPLITKLESLGVQLPGLFVLDADNDPVLVKESLPASQGEILNALKGVGG